MENDGEVFIGNPVTGDMKPLGWIGTDGLTQKEEDSTVPFPAIQGSSFNSKIRGRNNSQRIWRALLGLPYKHPRQVLHNGKKPRNARR